MLRQEIMQMPTDEQIILRPGMRPMKAKKVQWWPRARVHQTPEGPAGDPAVACRNSDG